MYAGGETSIFSTLRNKVHGNGLVEKKKKEEEKKAEEKAEESTAELRKATRNLQSHGLKRR